MSKARDADATEHLRCLAIAAIVRETGLNEEHALPFANAMIHALQQSYGGDRLFIPKPPANDDDFRERKDQIRDLLLNGASAAKVCRRFRVHRSTLHRMFPGGLPRPQAE